MSRTRGIATALAVAFGGGLVLAPSAFAGRIDYAVPPGADYEVKANGEGIVKVEYTRCLVAGETVRLPIDLAARGPRKGFPTAEWKVIKDGDSTLTFDPAKVTFRQEQQRATLTVGVGSPRNNGDFIRIKLDPENGSGLGEGPGIMVRFACILAAAPQPQPRPSTSTTTTTSGECPSTTTTTTTTTTPGTESRTEQPGNRERDPQPDKGKDGKQTEGTPPTTTTTSEQSAAPAQDCQPPAGAPAEQQPAAQTQGATLATPTSRTFPTVGSARASGVARCVATPRRVRVVAGETTTIVVDVRAGGRNIKGSLVRLTTPDRVIVARSDARGRATFRVRPSRSGRVVIQSDVCFGARTIAVRGARVSSRQGVSPTFTG